MMTSASRHFPLFDKQAQDSQLFFEEELQKYFRMSPPSTVTNEFKQITGSADEQIMYLTIALKVIEELDVEPVQAFGLLEALRPVIFDKFTILTSRFIGKSLLSNSKANQAVFNALSLYARLTATYDSVIEEAKYFGESQTFIMGGAIHRALADKSKLVLCYLQLYMDVPEDIWRHMNRLFQTADEYNILNQVMPDPLVFGDTQLSIRQIYTYTQALATCGSGSLTIDEILAISELLKAHVKSIKVLPTKPEKNALCIDPRSMLKARFSADIHSSLSDMAMYYDFSPLEKHFNKQHFTQVFVQSKRYILSPDVASKIYSNWTEPQVISSDRQAGSGQLLVRPGLVMNWCSQKLPDPDEPDDDVDERAFRNRKLDFYTPSDKLSFRQLEVIHPDSAGCHSAEVVDYSHSGYCLSWNMSVIPLLAVGELIVLNDPVRGSQCLCQIVWMKSAGNGRLRTGVSILSFNVASVYVRTLSSLGQPSVTLPALLLCNQNRGNHSYSLIVEVGKLSMRKIVSLIQAEKVAHAQILELCSTGSKYQVFNLAFYENPVQMSS